MRPTCGEQFHFCVLKPLWDGEQVPKTDPRNANEPVDDSLEASGNELLLKVQVEGETRQFLIDSGTSLSPVNPGVSQAEVRPTDLAARGITGTNLKRN